MQTWKGIDWIINVQTNVHVQLHCHWNVRCNVNMQNCTCPIALPYVLLHHCSYIVRWTERTTCWDISFLYLNLLLWGDIRITAMAKKKLSFTQVVDYRVLSKTSSSWDRPPKKDPHLAVWGCRKPAPHHRLSDVSRWWRLGTSVHQSPSSSWKTPYLVAEKWVGPRWFECSIQHSDLRMTCFGWS